MTLTYDEKLQDFVCSVGKPLIRICAVTPRQDYQLKIHFSNGEQRLFNVKPLLQKTIYAPLRDISFFMQAKILGCSVGWNDDIDIAPELLYEQSVPIDS